MTDSDLLPGKLYARLTPWRHAPRWLVGYSGGLDSSVLLHMLVRLSRELSLPPLLAIHVDHQLQAESASWRQHCQNECDALNVELRCIAVDVEKKSRVSPEDAARKARYAAFASVMNAGDVLLLAHHADDQAETFLLRALRGAGVAGLAATPYRRSFAGGAIVRPLLDVRRSELESYAATCHIPHVIDPSNDSPEFDRNYLRLQVFTLLKARWPQTVGRFNAASQHMAEANALLRELACDDLAVCDSKTLWGAPNIELAPLAQLSPQRQRNALRFFLKTGLPEKPIVLSQQQLLQLQLQWFGASEDANPQIDITGVQLRRYRGRGYICRALPEGIPCRWNLNESLVLPGIGVLRAQRGMGGLRLPDAIDIRFRRGGELWYSRGGNSQPLKQWFQENAIPPWWRDHLPLLFSCCEERNEGRDEQHDELVAIAGFDIAPAFRAAPNEEGWLLQFETA